MFETTETAARLILGSQPIALQSREGACAAMHFHCEIVRHLPNGQLSKVPHGSNMPMWATDRVIKTTQSEALSSELPAPTPSPVADPDPLTDVARAPELVENSDGVILE